MLTGVSNGVFDAFAIFHLIPLGVDEHIGQMQANGHVNVLFDDVQIVGTVVVGPVYPRDDTRLNPRSVSEAAGIADIGNESRLHHVGKAADDGDAPRRVQTVRSFLQLCLHNRIFFSIVK